MDIRSIFRNYLLSRYHDGGTQEANASPRLDVWVQACRGISPGKSGGSHSLRCHVEGLMARKVGDATLPRKASKERSGYPYRKPTQVGEEKILRRE